MNPGGTLRGCALARHPLPPCWRSSQVAALDSAHRRVPAAGGGRPVRTLASHWWSHDPGVQRDIDPRRAGRRAVRADSRTSRRVRGRLAAWPHGASLNVRSCRGRRGRQIAAATDHHAASFKETPERRASSRGCGASLSPHAGGRASDSVSGRISRRSIGYPVGEAPRPSRTAQESALVRKARSSVRSPLFAFQSAA